jgi:HrpA-like RNA helicase
MLTRLGRRIADFPLDSSLAKVLIVASELGCSDEILSIVAMPNQPNAFYRPKEKQAQVDQNKARFHDPHDDHRTLLNVYNAWTQSGYSNSWCFEHFVLARAMKQGKDVREQLARIMERYRLPIVSCGRETDRVRRALCAGFFRNAARRETGAENGDGSGGYKLLSRTPRSTCTHPRRCSASRSASSRYMTGSRARTASASLRSARVADMLAVPRVETADAACSSRNCGDGPKGSLVRADSPNRLEVSDVAWVLETVERVYNSRGLTYGSDKKGSDFKGVL